MVDLLKNYGMAIFDIKDFFSNSWVSDYKDCIVSTRKEFKSILNNCEDGGDSCPAQSPNFIQHMEKLLDKDYSYLYRGIDSNIKMNKVFLTDCLDYFDKNGINETYTNNDIPGLSTLSGGLYHMCPLNQTPINEQILEYLLMSDTINIKLMQTLSSEPLQYEVGDWVDEYVGWKNETRHKHLNLFAKNSFMPKHTDSQDDKKIKFVCQNYPNINRTISDGSLFRYFIEDEAYDVLTNYTSVIVFDYSKDIGKISHLVTKNNIDEYRYSLYNTYRK